MDASDGNVISIDQSHSPSSDGDSYHGRPALKKGPWTPAEDEILVDYVKKHGEGNWNAVQKYSGLSRCGKSCRLRWANHLRPSLKKGAFTSEEEHLIIELHAKMGNKWAQMAKHLPGRTDNEIKNYWNTRIKRHQRAGLPLYPVNMHKQFSSETQLCQDVVDFGRHKLLHLSNCDLYEAILNNFMMDQTTSIWEQSLPNISACKMLNIFSGRNGCDVDSNPYGWQNETKIRSPSYCSSFTYGHHKDPTLGQYAETKYVKDCHSFGFHVDYGPGVNTMSATGLLPGSICSLNDTFNTLQNLSKTVKLELPSFQNSGIYSDAQVTSAASTLEEITHLKNPTIVESTQPEPFLLNNGMLESLLYEAEAKIQESQNKMNFFAANNSVRNFELEKEFSTDASLFSSASNASSSFMSESPSNSMFGPNTMTDSAEQISNFFADEISHSHLDISRPDALLNSDWLFLDPIGNVGQELNDIISGSPGHLRPQITASTITHTH